MKKIVSYVLMATALLISGQVKAVDVSHPGEIQGAINGIKPGESVEIVLTDDITEEATIQIYAKYAETGKKVTIDLGGHTLSNATSAKMFELFKGELTIKNGTVTGGSSDVITVYGVYQNHPNWSILNIEKDAKIKGSNTAISVYEFMGTRYYANVDSIFKGVVCDGEGSNPAPLDSILPAYKYNKNGETVNAQGVVQRDWSLGKDNRHALATGENPAIDYTSQMPEYGTTIYKKNAKGKNATTFVTANYVGRYGWARRANGVVVNVRGYVKGDKYAIKVNGNLDEKTDNRPKMNIFPSAEVACSAGCNLTPEEQAQGESVAVYASGVAIWNIQGYVHGNIGVYVKAGTVELNDAVVEATGDHYSNVQGTKTGVSGASGCAIVVESNDDYAGGQQVTLNGDTKVTASDGYIIEETVTTGDASQLKSIIINGGILDAGESGGGIKVTVPAVANKKIIIYGGSVEGDSIMVGDKPMSLDSIKAPETNIINVGTEDHPIFVITKGKPAPTQTVDINSVPDSTDAKLSKSAEMIMNDNKVVGILYITEGTKLVIAEGKTLEAKKIIMGAGDTIVVPYNGKLIVTGSEGLYTQNEGNLILQAQGKQMATLLFKWSVIQNKQPYATIEYHSTAKQFTSVIAEGHTWDRLAMPFDTLTSYRTINKNQIEKWGTWGTWFQVWDPATGWKEAEYNSNNTPILGAFQGLALSNKSKNGDAKYEFKGRLQGVKQGTLDVKSGWNYYGNSFTADMDLNELLKQIDEQAGVSYIKFWDASKQKWVDVVYPQGIFGNYKKLNAMQDFMFKSDKTTSVDLNYINLIWNFNVTEE